MFVINIEYSNVYLCVKLTNNNNNKKTMLFQLIIHYYRPEDVYPIKHPPLPQPPLLLSSSQYNK
ncbi:hypothetical protein DERF_010522 [Dermatophagoides farinae]|uniref:Uncharacterized protein n=1 Tax=Dermatophagoides farinae TaxID=6954 RepID=A0A922L2N8_DERFA|nr:hypothetical protein DERF_010522 [Dermatophagoides farinae]